jgi:flavin prenyltransferase
MNTTNHHPLVVGVSGATGAVYGIETLRILKELGIPRHLVISEWGAQTIGIETDMPLEEVRGLADAVYSNKDLAAPISSGSFLTRGMVVAPCSVKTLSSIANGMTSTLIARAADVTLKERRRLVLVFREAPLHKGHIDLMARAADIGAVILPPMPAFYNRPQSIDDIVHHTVGKILDLFGIEHAVGRRWGQ